ncbi:DNA-binding domain-containing protein [Saccharothrix sp. S26]|uniref:HvfC/BufC N-terminal domain-containing protein n=1 Tax=Saccharothrix sp. S26 TaxID=2907215 RepID=UPI001F4862BB|nr:DNA-binding domain-containing protein [Saccharothrix sp. S26]MCE7001104.1 DNA-binding domain-containing protein [Saccharothrix sp. S26]
MPAERLRSLQGWLQGAIMDPAAATGVEDVVVATARLPAARRLAIYQHGYLSRLVECLGAHYPVTRHLLGVELFEEFARDYLAARPSRSYTLGALGAGLADHLAATRPDAGSGEREPWIDLVVDVVRFERAFTEAHGAEGAEFRAPPEGLPEPGSAGWAGTVVSTVGCLRLLRAGFPVHAFAVAVRARRDPPLPAPGEVRLVLARRDFVVTVAEVDEPRYRLLAALRSGVPVGRAGADAGLTPDRTDACLRAWIAERLIVALNGRTSRG